MKNPIHYSYLVLLLVVSSTIQAQNETSVKPSLFDNFPQRIDCSLSELNKVFTIAIDQPLNLSFSDNFLFSGTVTSSVVKYANLTSVVIKSPRFSNAIFVVSRIIAADGVSYTGRIINEKFNDGYELKKDGNNNYQLIKIEAGKLLQVCSQN